MPQSDGNDPAACVNVASAFRIAMWIPSLSKLSLLPVPTLWVCWRYLTCIPRSVGTVFVACTIVVAALRIVMWILSLCRKSCLCCKVVAALGDSHVIVSCCKLTLTPVLKLWQCLWFSRVFSKSIGAVFTATLWLCWRFSRVFLVSLSCLCCNVVAALKILTCILCLLELCFAAKSALLILMWIPRQLKTDACTSLVALLRMLASSLRLLALSLLNCCDGVDDSNVCSQSLWVVFAAALSPSWRFSSLLEIDWLIDDRLYSAILRSLEQTHSARMWFYMSD